MRAEALKAKVSLNDLPEWSVWPARLLGLLPSSICRRTIEKVDREYDKHKYARCLAFCRDRGLEGVTPEDVRMFEIGRPSNETICVSVGNNLFTMQLGDAVSHQNSLLIEAMRLAIEAASVVVELGCGYGYNLWKLHQTFPNKAFVGGEYSANAIRLAENLFRRYPNITVRQFNFYDEQYDALREADPHGPIVVFTCHAIEQMPSVSHVLDVLGYYREKVQTLFLFEPVYELYGDSLLGLLRRRYTEMNDYNRDLYSQLKRRPNIRIVHIEADGFGRNPLNPTSIIQWEFDCA